MENNWTPDELKRYADAIINREELPDGEEYPNPDKLYACALAAQNGEIEETEKGIEDLFDNTLYNAIMQVDYMDEVFEKYPLAVFRLPAMAEQNLADDIGSQKARDLADECYERGDTKTAFALYLGGAVSLKRYRDRFSKINQRIMKDSCALSAAECYKDGIGTERNYVQAFTFYWNYHTNYYAAVYGSDNLQEEDIADLYQRMKAESDAGINYPGLHYALALMAGDGFGTAYNHELYQYYYDKEMENYAADAEPEYNYPDMLNEYDATISHKPIDIKEACADDISDGDVIRLGKYNHRDILWRVVITEDDKALLLSMDCLESSRFVNEGYQQYAGENKEMTYAGSPIHYFLHYKMDRAFANVEEEWPGFNADERIPKDEFENYTFLLGKDVFEKYNIPGMWLYARAVEQAKRNGVYVDEETGVSPWWTSMEGKEKGTLVCVGTDFCESDPLRMALCLDDDFLEQDIDCEEIGIRPAMWLKIK